jgi:transcriptional regulator of arginine metabolism
MHKHASTSAAPQPLTKAHRQGIIRSLLRASSPRSQAEMLRRLRVAGVRVTQSTLSRDLRDIGLLKGPGGYREAQEAGNGADHVQAMERMLRTYLTDLATAGNLVVLKTSPGLAHALGVALDRASLPEAVGTVAGDDTLFVATPHPTRARALQRRLRGLIGRR